jgi:hypothetical protein
MVQSHEPQMLQEGAGQRRRERSERLARRENLGALVIATKPSRAFRLSVEEAALASKDVVYDRFGDGRSVG